MAEIRRGFGGDSVGSERLPWLEPVEDEDDFEEVGGFGGLIIGGFVLLAVIVLIVAAIVWYGHSRAQTADIGTVGGMIASGLAGPRRIQLEPGQRDRPGIRIGQAVPAGLGEQGGGDLHQLVCTHLRSNAQTSSKPIMLQKVLKSNTGGLEGSPSPLSRNWMSALCIADAATRLVSEG